MIIANQGGTSEGNSQGRLLLVTNTRGGMEIMCAGYPTAHARD